MHPARLCRERTINELLLPKNHDPRQSRPKLPSSVTDGPSHSIALHPPVLELAAGESARNADARMVMWAGSQIKDGAPMPMEDVGG